MERNVILAGVGGQGILTIARAISRAAQCRGLRIKQSEVHGMAQRGGAVHAHLRLSNGEIHSDLIPCGKADLILSLEPLEALRYAHYLRPGGEIVTSTNAVTNISNYPPVEETLNRIAQRAEHVLLDAAKLAALSGSPRASNVVLLGAVAEMLDLPVADLEAALLDLFGGKGDSVVAANGRALRFGASAALAYQEGLRRGGGSPAVRRWVDQLSAQELISGTFDFARFESTVEHWTLSTAESHAVRRVLEHVRDEGRSQLLEHEVYVLVELTGAISPPRYHFVPRGDRFSAQMSEQLQTPRIVLKIVSPNVIHKSEAGGVRIVQNEAAAVNREISRLVAQHADTARVDGVLAVEFVEHLHHGFGSELFVGIRATREFGPVIAAGLGGVETEFLARRMLPGVAVAKAVVTDTTPEQFFELFRRTAAYEVLAGKVRGHDRVVSDAELLHCFRAFMAVARQFCRERDDGCPTLEELEVNPFAFRRQRMVPLDGRGRIGAVVSAQPPRPLGALDRLFDPRSIAVLGVSADGPSFGRVILNNIQRCGFPQERLYAVRPGMTAIDGTRCVPDVAALPETVDLLIVATGAMQLPSIVRQTIASGKARTCIMISGGVGETEGSDDLFQALRTTILSSRGTDGAGPVFVGPNCLGIQSRTGRYDTFFVPRDRLNMNWNEPSRPAAIISQSGAFIITRLSNLECLNPVLTVSIGNQIDITLSDMLSVAAERDDLRAIGVYAEGFTDLDGLAFLAAVKKAVARNKTVIFYKAGRTDPGRSAAAGHTASVAGDYDVCQAAVSQAGAIVVDTFKEFEQLVELSVALCDRRVAGRRIAAVTNAGFEAVGMADAIQGPRYRVEVPPIDGEAGNRLAAILAQHHLSSLVNARNPLDLTANATEAAFEDCVRLFIELSDFDAVVVSVVPMAPQLLAFGEDLHRPECLAQRVAKLFRESTKPVVFVIDAGPLYDPMARIVRAAGVPVFRSSDQAIRSLGRYLCFRAPLSNAAHDENRPEPPTGPRRRNVRPRGSKSFPVAKT